MEIKHLLIPAVALAAGLAGPAKAATVVAFKGVSGSTVNGVEEGAGVSQFNLGRSIGLTQNSGATFNSRDWEEGTDKASALANNNAIFWGFNTTSAYDLTSLEISYDRSNTGPSNIAIELFLNGALQGEIFGDSDVSPTGETALVDLSAFNAVVGSVFFRLSGWGASSANGTFDIENELALGSENYGIIISGDLTVPAVPLPASLPLLAAGLGGVFALRRRKAG